LSAGTVGYPVAEERVHAAVDVVELTAGRHVPPRGSAARRLRAAAPDGLVFTVQVPHTVFLTADERPAIALPGDPQQLGECQTTEENLALWRRGLDFAAGVAAEALVMVTPAWLTPAPANVTRLSRFLAAVDRGGRPLVWEPHGPWEIELAAALARDNELVLAVDPLRDEPPPGPLAYLRLGPFAAMGSRVGVYDLERIAAAARGFDRAFCVFDTPRALDDARNLKQILEPAE
jgi:uncharacterized protein YecE (DUF72 family)